MWSSTRACARRRRAGSASSTTSEGGSSPPPTLLLHRWKQPSPHPPFHRLNVALTRARHALYIVGNAESLRQSADWRALLDDAAARGCVRRIAAGPAEQPVSVEQLLRLIPHSLLDGSSCEPWTEIRHHPRPSAALVRLER